ncbi:MAG TPA: hypothetical protein ENK18_20665 [Deltaproteobacteria bacterium]|nr:hypothetical protein [Deltaproteobacteria bacterium]
MRASLVLLFAASAVGACGYNCQSTCFRIHDPSACAVEIAGQTPQSRIQDCTVQCENALERVGPMGSYDPTLRSQESLLNEQQAAAWMDCVWAVECSELDPVTGACHPLTPDPI